jgi:ABC-type nitrate/sulfonate/bicarbonate transport system substrate-binding protein
MKLRTVPRFALLLSFLLLLTACPGEEPEEPAAPPADDPADPEEEPADPDDEVDEVDEVVEAERTCDGIDLTAAPDEPVTIRLGHGFAAEEQVWLMEANADITEHQGTWYTLEMTAFRGNEERFVAYQAGELDAATATSVTLARAVARGIDLQAVVTATTESEAASFRTTFSALEDSGITSIEELEGRTIGIVDIGSATEFWARSAVASAGLDHNTDVEYVVLPFPAHEEAVRTGQIDVGVFVEPFYTMAQGDGGLVDVFDALTGPGFDQELILVTFGEDFLDENPEAVCAYVEDFQTATAWYNDNLDEAKEILVEAGYVQTPLEVYLASGDWLHPDGGVIDLEAVDRVIDSMIEFGVMRENERVPAEDLVATEFAPLAGQE